MSFHLLVQLARVTGNFVIIKATKSLSVHKLPKSIRLSC